ncbi:MULTISPECIES: protease pro-enzyme activation domain-containing protein [Acidobacteriaceae]|uniref:S53 family peptidase n=1 Tax=Acidobacteriaceae TaxID=204434 RepID=UPI00131C310B|nr:MULTISPECIES: S53 family peptidase [Acidobacteriaceae]MDW5267771.1 S53 family peptidase [Edaphobacter sp.]
MPTKKSASRFATQSRIVLPGSQKPSFVQPATEKPVPAATRITVSVMVKCKTPLKAANRLGKERLTRAQFRQSHGPDPDALKLIRAFAKEYGLTPVAGTPIPGSCILKLTGTIAAMQKAFGATLVHKVSGAATYRIREGNITLPSELSGKIEAVLGLDNRPQAQPHFRVAHGKSKPIAQGGGFATPQIRAQADISYTPVQVAQLYQFPANASGAGQTIGILELGGGYRTADLTAYFKTLGQTAPTVTAVSVDGAKNSPSTADGADGEVMLDIEVSAAVAPGANIAVYFAPNTDQGFLDGLDAAIHDTTNKPSVISISWGSAEANWTQQSMTALDTVCQSAAALGISITVAAGDNGSSDGGTGNNVDFPSSSPHVLACGGTTLTGSGSTITSEVVWNEQASNEGATGGGVSNVFPLPSWQANSNVPAPSNSTGGRGVPDVCGNADPATGYTVRVDGQTLVIGGTSAVAPLWAGLIAVANQQNGTTAGFLQPQIYAAKAKSGFRDITSGNNGSFSAGPGWDACTGLGSPITGTLIPFLATGTTSGKKHPKPKPPKKKPTKKSNR